MRRVSTCTRTGTGPRTTAAGAAAPVLLLDEAPWTGGLTHYDLTVFLDVPLAELERRLLARWAQYGRSPEAARAWIDGNDLPNIRRVIEGSRPADIRIGP